jgi:hypothetical protein
MLFSIPQIPLKIYLILDIRMVFSSDILIRWAWFKRAFLSSSILFPTIAIYFSLANQICTFEIISCQIATVLSFLTYSLFGCPKAVRSERYLPTTSFIEKHSVSAIFNAFLGAFVTFFLYLSPNESTSIVLNMVSVVFFMGGKFAALFIRLRP